MNRNYRRYNYNRNSYTEPKTFSAYSYIENEFFNADDELFQKISNLYFNIYGERPYRYLLNTYNSLKSGSVKTSRQTMKRIFRCVPRFLTDEKRFIILKNEILFFILEASNYHTCCINFNYSDFIFTFYRLIKFVTHIC